MRAWRIFVLTLAAVTMLGLFGCENGSGKDPGGERPAARDSAAPRAGALTIPEPMRSFQDDGDVAEIRIEGDDRIQFDKDRFSVRPGQMVRLTLVHVGQLPVQSMGHNVVILKQGDDVFEFAADVNEQGGAMDNDYVPEPLRDRVVALTAMIGGDETTVVEFRAPKEAGPYPFLCSFPGHAGSMNGIMEVEA